MLDPSDISMTIFDIATNTAITTISPGDEVPYALIDGLEISIVVEILDPMIDAATESVQLQFGDSVRTESVEPYTLFGDIGGEFLGGTELGEGDFSIELTGFPQDNGAGTPTFSTALDFSVVEEVSAPDNALEITLIDTETDEVLATLSPSDEIPADLVEGRSVSLSVDAIDPDFAESIGSMRLTLGGQSRIENAAPYALYGNIGEDFFDGQSLGEGGYTLEIEVFSERGATGTLLASTEADFSVAGPEPEPEPENQAPVAEDDDVATVHDTTILVDVLANDSDPDGDALTLTDVSYDGSTAIVTIENNQIKVNPLNAATNERVEAITYTVTDTEGNTATATLEVTVAGATTPPPTPTGNLAEDADHIIFHFDGNNNDPDDIAAIPIAALLASAGGIADKMTFAYGNNLAEVSSSTRFDQLDQGAAFAESLGIDTLSYETDPNATTNALVEKLNSGDKVLLIEGGPMEAIYRAIDLMDPAYYENVTLISHSTWNETRSVINAPGVTEARTWADLKSDFPDLTFIDIQDQNNGNNNTSGFNNSDWTWMDGSDEPLIQEAREIMIEAGTTKRNDPSDAGMLFYALTGEEDGTAIDARTYFESSSLFDTATPAPDGVYLAQNGQIIMEAENGDASGLWAEVTVDGETSMLWDAASSSYSSVPTGEQISFAFQTDDEGTYSLALHSARNKSVMGDSELFEGDGTARTDTGNDVYVRVTNAETGEVVVSPIKLYTGLGGSDLDLRWGTTFDANGNHSPAQFELDGDTTYQLDIIGRSDGYVLDRITLNNGGPLRDADTAESPIASSTSSAAANAAPITFPEDLTSGYMDPFNKIVGSDIDYADTSLIEAEDALGLTVQSALVAEDFGL